MKGNIRTVGYPGVSKEIDYETHSATVRPRGLVGRVAVRNESLVEYTVLAENWKDGPLEGFSGSPILEFLPTAQGPTAVPIGVFITSSSQSSTHSLDDATSTTVSSQPRIIFLSINVVTNAIAGYFNGTADPLVEI